MSMRERISTDMYRPILQFQLVIQVECTVFGATPSPSTIQGKVYIDAFPGNLVGNSSGSQVF